MIFQFKFNAYKNNETISRQIVTALQRISQTHSYIDFPSIQIAYNGNDFIENKKTLRIKAYKKEKIKQLRAENEFLKREIIQKNSMIESVIKSVKQDAIMYQKKMNEYEEEITMYKTFLAELQ